ncbi:Mo-dependent nitrogenase C-terminal domain-containing protein [Leptothermofonsia sp. ETS-13]|uniref:Mo-dependent nitrogenase C-terminal domain-containing protein n=1 Tax=Leptothermofonsia sp. ETS-13 TaxID=3035696 RepID=UPI003BA165A7
MDSSRYEISTTRLESFIWISKEVNVDVEAVSRHSFFRMRFTPLLPLRRWLNGIRIHNARTARMICRVIPDRCPFERTVTAFGRPIFRIPPLCKLNPLYEELVDLRFRALCYLADECGEDVSVYFSCPKW